MRLREIAKTGHDTTPSPIHPQGHAYDHVRVCLHICMYVCMFVCLHVSLHVSISMFASWSDRPESVTVFMYGYVHARMSVVSVYVCV